MTVQVSDAPLAPFFTPRTLAAYLALSERSTRELLAERDGRPAPIPSYKIGGARRIRPADVDAFLEGCRTLDA